MSQYDRRQLLNMQKVIESFKENAISLSSFIDRMDFLYRAIEEKNKILDDLVFEELTDLDSVNAGFPATVSNEQIENIIFQTTSILEKLVNERLQNLIEFQITKDDISEKFIDLLEDNISHEDTANWAYSIIQQDG